MTLARLALLAALAPFVSGCNFGGPQLEIARLGPSEETAATDAGMAVTTGDLDRPYDEVAILTVGPRGWGSTADLVKDLRRAALRAEADAVVRVDFDQYADESGVTHRIATGTAVRFR